MAERLCEYFQEMPSSQLAEKRKEGVCEAKGGAFAGGSLCESGGEGCEHKRRADKRKASAGKEEQ